jgi:biopolymer transport protein ExbD
VTYVTSFCFSWQHRGVYPDNRKDHSLVQHIFIEQIIPLNMRIFIFLFCLIYFTGCNTQQQNLSLPTIDTLDISDFNNHGIFNKISQSKNAMIVEDTIYGIQVGDSQYTITNKVKLSTFLQQNASIIQQKKFYVLLDNISNKGLSEIFSIIKSANIDNYKIYDIQSKKITPPSSVKITSPAFTSSTETEIKDSASLIIKIEKTDYKISLLNDTLVTNNTKKIDAFISANKDKINENKIIISGNANEPYKKFDKLLNVLKKHEIFRFQLLTNPN